MADPYANGLALVAIGRRFGYIDAQGKFAINPQFEGAGSFDDGLAPVLMNGKWGYIDRAGKLSINPQFDEAGKFLGRSGARPHRRSLRLH